MRFFRSHNEISVTGKINLNKSLTCRNNNHGHVEHFSQFVFRSARTISVNFKMDFKGHFSGASLRA